MPLHINTPLLKSEVLSAWTGRSIWLKFDALQPSGSFKIRGVGFACEEYKRMGKKGFISSSGGNAGLAVAYAGRRLGMPVTVVVPETTSERAKALVAQQNAKLVVTGASWQEANEAALALAGPDDAFIHPFDDPLLWQGHASLVDEIVQDGLNPDLVVLSVGGGGLLSGVIEGLRRNGLNSPVLAVETVGASSLAKSVAAGERVVLPSITSIASSLGAKQVSRHAFELTRSYPINCATVSDRVAVEACVHFLDDHRVLVEPACGASLAAAYGNLESLGDAENVLIIVCGGSTTTVDQLRAWHSDLQ